MADRTMPTLAQMIQMRKIAMPAWWPRPGSDKPLEKTTFYTKAGDQICAVGYYKE